jgi:hypothetical protein
VPETPAERAGALAVKLAHTYEELTRLLERNPGMKRQMTEGEGKEEKVYQKLKQRLKMADMAPRCQWVRQDGTSCRSPQLKQHIYCFAHRQMAEARTLMLMLPAAEDANAIQVGLMRIQKALIEDTISMKKAGLLLYSMQLALTNVGQTTFGQAKDEEMVRETVDEEDAFSEKALSSQHSAFSEKQSQHQRAFTTEGTEDTEENGRSGHREIGTSENQNQHQNQRPFTAKDAEEIGTSGDRDIGTSENQNQHQHQRPFTAKDAEDAKESKPTVMNADERGLQGEESRQEVEFVPVPGGYGFERVRLRIEPELGGQRRPAQGVIAPEERAEVHANLG